MIQALIAAACIGAILFLSELCWRRMNMRGELARKFVHIGAGTFIAFLPFWVSYEWIALLGLIMIAVNAANRNAKMFQSVHAVKRVSWGDILLGLAVTFCALLEPSPWFFAAAILQVALADGLAAVVGVSIVRLRGRYKVLGHDKTVAGTLTFFVVSAAIIALALGMEPSVAAPVSQWPLVVMLSLLLTAVENFSVLGFDNLLLPLITVWILGLL